MNKVIPVKNGAQAIVAAVLTLLALGARPAWSQSPPPVPMPAYNSIISLHFLSYLTPAEDSLAPSQVAGVVAVGDWNTITNEPSDIGISGPLMDNGGNPTSVQLIFASDDDYVSTYTYPANAQEEMMWGIFKEDISLGAQPPGLPPYTMELAFTNLAPGAYDIIVYGLENGGPYGFDIEIGTQTNWWMEPDSFIQNNCTPSCIPPDTFEQAIGGSATSSATNFAFGNYIEFTNISPVNGGILMIAHADGSDGNNNPGGSADGLGIAALQIFSTNLFLYNTPLAITSGPYPTLAPPGGTATFAVGVSGSYPGFQWYSNNAAIAGATASAYTTAPVTPAESGAQFHVIASNSLNTVTSTAATLTVAADPGTRPGAMGVNFLGNANAQAPWFLPPAASAGVVAQSHWNNVSGAAGAANLLEGNGNFSTVAFDYAADDAGVSAAATFTTPDEMLMKGILVEDSPDGSQMTLAFSGLPVAYYDVVCVRRCHQWAGGYDGQHRDPDQLLAGACRIQ